MKKFLIVLLGIISALACAFGISACNLFDEPKDEGKDDGVESGHVHSTVHVDGKPATCTEEGNMEYWYCDSCGDYFSDASCESKVAFSSLKTDKASHTIVVDEAVEKTCTKPGKTEGKHCSVCGKVIVAQKDVPAGHEIVIDPAKLANCTTEGVTEGKHCKYCNEVFVAQTTVPASGHKTVHKEAKEADCADTGNVDHWHCSACNKNFTDANATTEMENVIIPAKEHKLTHVDAKTADCANAGNEEHWHCSVCNKNFTTSTAATEIKDVTIPVTEHTYTEAYICTLCGNGTATAGLQYAYNSDEGTYTVTGIGTASGDIIIPHYYNGKLVTVIGEDAFHGCGEPWSATPLTSVVIPDSVFAIETQGFCECTELKSITFGKGVYSLGDNVFGYCIGLEEINVVDGNPMFHSDGNCLIDTVAKTIVLGCNKSVIPADSSVTSIGENAFTNCTLSDGFVIPENITTIGDWAFSSCTGLTKITLPAKINSLGKYVFAYYNGLTEITVPESVTGISGDTFMYCYGLKRVYYYGTRTQWNEISGVSGKTAYDLYCMAEFNYEYNAETDSYYVSFTQNVDFGNIIMPSTYNGKPVTAIGGDAFVGCTITGMLIPDNVTTIDGAGFNFASGLKTLIIGSGLTECNFADVFGYSKDTLSEIIISDDNPAFYSEGNCIIEKESKTLVYGGNNGVIPDDGSVTAIAGNAFAYATQLKSVTVPSGVETIGGRAFYGCTSLNSIVFPDSVKEVGANVISGTAYYNDASKWDGDLLYINNHLVAAKSSISSFPQIKAGTLTLAASLFDGNSTMTGSVNLPDSLVSIGSEAFYNCKALTGQLVIPAGVESIGTNAFSICDGLTGVTFSDGIISIGNNAFSYCEGITGSVTIPASVTYIGGNTFYICSNLEEINVDADNTKYASYQGILYNKELTEIVDVPRGIKGDITIPDGVTKIAQSEFYYCVNLESIRIPDSVTEIGSYAFYHCVKLTSVNIPDGITAISSSTFYECTSLKSITIPESVTKIGSEAFRSSGLSGELVISDNVTEVGSSAFQGCGSLTSVKLPDGITEIAYALFMNCSNLTSVNVPDSVTSIEYGAFASCGKLESIDIPDGVTKIGELAFYDCRSLTELTLPQSLETIGKRAFEECSGLTGELVIPVGVTSIGDSAFNGCRGLTALTIPNTVISIGSKAFYNCVCLSGELIIPDSVESIGNYAFAYCGYYGNLTSIKISNGITSINSGVFEYCKNLESVIIPDDVETIGSSAFYHCEGLESVTIPKSVTVIKYDAFTQCIALKDVYYDGTTDEWNALVNGVSWAYQSGNYTVHCSNGDIVKAE